MSNKRFHVIIKRTYATCLRIEAESEQYIDDVINSEDHVEQIHMDDFWEVLASQELEQMDVEINDWEIDALERQKSDLILD